MLFFSFNILAALTFLSALCFSLDNILYLWSWDGIISTACLSSRRSFYIDILIILFLLNLLLYSPLIDLLSGVGFRWRSRAHLFCPGLPFMDFVLQFLQVVAIRDIIPPPRREAFNDVYIAYELMDTDLHQIIRSNQGLSEEHCQVFIQSDSLFRTSSYWNLTSIDNQL